MRHCLFRVVVGERNAQPRADYYCARAHRVIQSLLRAAPPTQWISRAK